MANDFIKTTFTINDLENLSGVKKHTIRIWEKRYKILTPERTDTNIRFYSADSFLKLMNVVLLYNNGFKISKIAAYSQNEILEHCRNLVTEEGSKNQFINDMKISMMHFDHLIFEKAYQKLNEQESFSEIFQAYFMPFLKELGLLWQTGTVNPAHEHFITNLIKQKVLVQTEKINFQTPKTKPFKFILFLPDNELHDLGITYLNFEILKNGFSSVFLGQSVPMDSLTSFTSGKAKKLIFISYFTIKPDLNKVNKYLEDFHSTLLSSNEAELWILGHLTQQINLDKLPQGVKIFDSMKDVLDLLD